MTSVRRQFARNAAILSGQAVVQRVLGMLTSVVLARGLGAAGLGALNAMQSTAMNAYGLTRLGVDVAAHVHLAETDGRPETDKAGVVAAAALLMSGAALLGAAACWAGAGWLARVVFEEPTLTPWLRVSSLLVLAQFGHQFGYSTLAGLHAFGRYARVAIGAAVGTLIATAAGVWFAGLAGAVGATVAMGLAGAVWLGSESARALRGAGIRPRLAGWARPARELLRLGGPFYLTGFLLIPVAYGLQGLLTRTGGLDEMGYLRVMLSISAIVSFLPSSLIGATVSSLALLRTDPNRGAEEFARHAGLNLRLVWLFCLLAALALAAILVPLVQVLFGGDYLVAAPAYRWGLFGAALLAVEGVVGQVLLAGRRVWALFGLLAGRASAFAALGALLIPDYAIGGYLAAEALSLGLFVPVGVAVFVVRARREGAGAGDVPRLLVLLLLTACAGAAVLPTWPGAWPTIAVLAMLFVVAGLGYAVVLDDAERSALRRAARRAVAPAPADDEPR